VKNNTALSNELVILFRQPHYSNVFHNSTYDPSSMLNGSFLNCKNLKYIVTQKKIGKFVPSILWYTVPICLCGIFLVRNILYATRRLEKRGSSWKLLSPIFRNRRKLIISPAVVSCMWHFLLRWVILKEQVGTRGRSSWRARAKKIVTVFIETSFVACGAYLRLVSMGSWAHSTTTKEYCILPTKHACFGISHKLLSHKMVVLHYL
jgi:hypothetical protein